MRLEILPTDTHILLGTDGLWNCFTCQSLLKMLQGTEENLKYFAETILKHTKGDNAALMVFKL